MRSLQIITTGENQTRSSPVISGITLLMQALLRFPYSTPAKALLCTLGFECGAPHGLDKVLTQLSVPSRNTTTFNLPGKKYNQLSTRGK